MLRLGARLLLSRSTVSAQSQSGSRSLWGFNFLREQPARAIGTTQEATVPPEPAQSAETSAENLPPSSSAPAIPSPAPGTHRPSATSERDDAALKALLDRDGGPSGFEFEDGVPEGGQRKAVKREMFRVI